MDGEQKGHDRTGSPCNHHHTAIIASLAKMAATSDTACMAMPAQQATPHLSGTAACTALAPETDWTAIVHLAPNYLRHRQTAAPRPARLQHVAGQLHTLTRASWPWSSVSHGEVRIALPSGSGRLPRHPSPDRKPVHDQARRLLPCSVSHAHSARLHASRTAAGRPPQG